MGDTTELRVGQGGRLFLAAIVDLFSRFVVGWALSAVNDRQLVIRALEMALRLAEEVLHGRRANDGLGSSLIRF